MSDETTTTEGGAPPPNRQKASTGFYKRKLRAAIAKNHADHIPMYLNITAMLDMMTIILVFMLKSMSNSAASMPQADDLKLPKTVLSTEMSEEAQSGVAVVISRSQITIDGNFVASVPANPVGGLEAKYKRSGPNDLYIVPLANQARAWRERDKQIRQVRGKDASFSEALVIADKGTPFRLILEVFNTLNQSEFAKLHLMALQGK
jgi:biopolymer transport protein ExbD